MKTAHAHSAEYFNGNGHCIEGLYTYTGNNGGLFGYVYRGIIGNVIMKDCCIIAQSDTHHLFAGGVVGLMDGGLIDNCDFDGNVYAVGQRDNTNGIALGGEGTNAGGIVGGFTVSNAGVADGAGYLLLSVFTGAAGFIFNPAIAGMVSGGGVVNYCVVSNCINHGHIYINSPMGAYFTNIGGISGYCHTGKIISCANFGLMFSDYSDISAGGIIGQEFNTYMEKCYYQTTKLDTGVGMIRDDGAVLEDVKPSDTAIRTTADEMAVLTQEELEEKLSDCFINVGNQTRLKCDLRYTDGSEHDGDLNNDNEFNVADVVILQKYLLSVPDVTITDWRKADLYTDGILDVFDLCMMRKKFTIHNLSTTK